MGKEARKLGSCFIPLAIAAAGLMAGRCTPGIPPSSARHAPEAVEDSDVDLEAVLPLHPEIAASLDAIEGESELEALLSIDDQEAIEGVRAGVRLGVRAGIRAGRRAEDTAGVRLGVRLGAQNGVRLAGHRQVPIIHKDTSPETNPLDRMRVPLTLTTEFPTPPSIENRTPDSRKLPSVPPASPPDLSSLGFLAHFRVPPERLTEGHHNIHIQIRPRMRPDLSLLEVKKQLRIRVQRSEIGDQQAETDSGLTPGPGPLIPDLEIEETPIEPDEIDLPDQDGDNVASALEIAARLAGPNRAVTDPLEDAFALAAGPMAPDGPELRAALDNLAEQFREKMRQTARTAGIPLEEVPDLAWAASDFSPPETTAVADRNIVRPIDTALVMLTCSKTECAFRCSWVSPAGSRANEPCKSPLTFQSDQTGEHRLLAAAVDTLGTRDLSPVEIVFQVVSDVVCVSESCGQVPSPEIPAESPPSEPAPVVSLAGDDSVPPDTRLTAFPSRLTRADTATFEFAASETAATFACGLGLGAPFTCTSPFALIGLKEGIHLFRVFAVDAAGNRDPSPAMHEWLVDRTPPTPGQVVAAGPGDSGYLRSTTALSMAWTGFSDEPSGIQSFNVHVNTQSDCAGERQGDAEAGLAHSFETTGLNLLDGTTYFACVQATDRAGNAGAWVSSRGVTVDVSEPTSAIVQPAAGTKLSALATIGGMAADAISGVAGVGLTIRRETDGLYWDGTSWRNGPVWNKAAGGAAFIYSNVPLWESGMRYVLRSRAADSAGNVESRDTISIFTFDSTPPEFVGATSAGSLANAVRVSWSPATDTVSARLAIRYVICRSTTAGGCNPFNATAMTPPGATQFDFTGLKANTTYSFVVRARDEAGNADENLAEVSATTGNAN